MKRSKSTKIIERMHSFKFHVLTVNSFFLPVNGMRASPKIFQALFSLLFLFMFSFVVAVVVQ